MIVLKLGGSVITEKDREETIDEDRLAALAGALAGQEDVALVHGAGSFGHRYAAKHGVSITEGTHDGAAVREIHGSMERLNERVLSALGAEGVSAVPVDPLSLAYRTREGELSLPLDGIETMLAEGFVPVTYGDVITQQEKGATIVSGDELVVALAEGLDADGVGLCSTVPGVLDDAGAVIPRIGSYDEVAEYLGESDSTDVTGGMAAKVRALLELEAPASVFGPDAIGRFLAGEGAGTRID
ncbi:isopentenyl phosphate kinase [Halalkalicoccus jeotgali]|uniref:Isopentenyl phosphate kinase n=1 Tax=Halalkalicoccus jeotgali (strain DSM 18796 / CECT 7217 / JCM 14584 / KCTC 4019 / B3) TaxID=795797 RepID=D8J317_HALJB|nr:isopentenyl phosphate kinase [Halalkalicoccus jeotgali]ADJ15124.1 isopentenyl phosphate kinase [Halalkalicoccus jeotgali B3]ELY34856.1 isopentenyl phosphate kinase [Halalkalicoccus jeotgali B3]